MKGVLLLTLVKEALLLALVKVLLVGVGFDEVGAGFDEVGAGFDEVGAGFDEVGAGFDEEGRVGGYAKTQGGRGRSKPYSPPLLKRSFSPGSPVEF